MIRVTLDRDQELRGITRGFTRQKHAVLNGLVPRHRGHASLWGSHAEGAAAELACSIATGLPWTGEEFLAGRGAVPPPDIGEATEVRWVAPTSGLTLNIDARRDDPERDYVLVIGFAPVYDVIGYLRGADARRTSWLTVYPEREVYRVPAHELRPLNPDEEHALR